MDLICFYITLWWTEDPSKISLVLSTGDRHAPMTLHEKGGKDNIQMDAAHLILISDEAGDCCVSLDGSVLEKMFS